MELQARRDSRYDILFEPVKIGPVTARNRFYQVPHCNGMGHLRPRAHAAMRGVKAEGGWAVVCTEEVELHATSDIAPCIEGRLWDDRDIPAMALLCDAIHEHGSLAGVELQHHGLTSSNYYSREIPLAPSHQPVTGYAPVQARAMDLEDIRNYRRWHKNAAIRAMKAGADIVYVYGGHGLGLPDQYLSLFRNHRNDDYGQSAANRSRLFRELIEDTKEVIGHRCAVAVRFSMDDWTLDEDFDEAAAATAFDKMAELPDLWDVVVSSWKYDSTTSRFTKEGSQERYIRFIKKLTTKPVVGVGRFTSPDTMLSLVKGGVLDFIGAARPSIADPFLPKKIEEGRFEDIRECIGCNMCVIGDWVAAPIRCTQNPTMGEEWRKGWHPEIIPVRKSDDSVLIIGAGPAGMECARALGGRGYRVQLTDASRELGGRVTKESQLPNLSEWARVRDYRLGQIGKMSNVEIYPESEMQLGDILDMDVPVVVCATGSDWRRDGVGRTHLSPVFPLRTPGLYTPDDVISGASIKGPVVIYDDDHYYMGGVLAEKLRRDGLEVTLVTPAPIASAWTVNTLEADPIQKRLLDLGVTLVLQKRVERFDGEGVEVACVYTGKMTRLPAVSFLTVTARLPREGLYLSLKAALAVKSKKMAIRKVQAIGDCLAPGTIAAAVYSGHRFAREMDEIIDPDTVPFRREMPDLVNLG